MKILVIGNFREQSGWSEQCRNTILVMDAAGLEVVPRNITILGNQCELPDRIKELEKNSPKNPHVIYQNVLPSMAEYHAGAKNVLFYVSESSSFKAAGWQNRINLFDEVVNCCFWNKEVSKKSGVTRPIHIIPQAIDLAKSAQEYPTHEIRKLFRDEFIFYTIADWTTRKNLEQTIRAFHTEFKPTESVQLIIKTNGQLQDVQNKVNSIKMGLKLYRDIDSYKREILMVGQAGEQEIYSLHQGGNCFVSTSHAEAFCIPAAVAMSMGKHILVPNYGGFQEYCTEKNSWLIKGVEDNIHSATDQMADLYTGREQWYYPDTNHLRQLMRQIFENHHMTKSRLEQAKRDIQKLSYLNVGKMYKEVFK